MVIAWRSLFLFRTCFQLYQGGWVSFIDLMCWTSRKVQPCSWSNPDTFLFFFPTILVLIANFEVIEVKPYPGLAVWNRNGFRRAISKVPELSQLLPRLPVSQRLTIQSAFLEYVLDFLYFKMQLVCKQCRFQSKSGIFIKWLCEDINPFSK